MRPYFNSLKPGGASRKRANWMIHILYVIGEICSLTCTCRRGSWSTYIVNTTHKNVCKLYVVECDFEVAAVGSRSNSFGA